MRGRVNFRIASTLHRGLFNVSTPSSSTFLPRGGSLISPQLNHSRSGEFLRIQREMHSLSAPLTGEIVNLETSGENGGSTAGAGLAGLKMLALCIAEGTEEGRKGGV